MDTDEALLVVLVAVLLMVSLTMVRPYLQFVLAAFLLAFVLRPVQRRLAPHVGRSISATVVLVLSVVTVVLPFLLFSLLVAGDVRAFVDGLQGRDLPFDAIEEAVARYAGVQIDVGEAVRTALSGYVGFDNALQVFGTLTHLLLGLGLLLFLLFFLVRDGDRLVAWLQETSPLPRAVTDDLLDRYANVTSAVLLGHVLVALIQGGLAGIGLFLFGVPNPVLLTFAMVLMGFVPIVGPFAIWIPAIGYLLATGRTVAGAGLLVYGVTVVTLSDDYVRPVVIDRYAEVSPGVVILGVLGGLSLFGFVGLFVGPIVVAGLKETVEVYAGHYGSPAREAG
jgi:predicted PurR-regulated permease PerM